MILTSQNSLKKQKKLEISLEIKLIILNRDGMHLELVHINICILIENHFF